MLRILVRAVGEQNNEFVAAGPRRDIGIAQSVSQGLGNGDNQPVADFMPVLIIEFLELVDISQHHGIMDPIPVKFFLLFLQGLGQIAAVEKSGQGILVRLFLKLAQQKLVLKKGAQRFRDQAEDAQLFLIEAALQQHQPHPLALCPHQGNLGVLPPRQNRIGQQPVVLELLLIP